LSYRTMCHKIVPWASSHSFYRWIRTGGELKFKFNRKCRLYPCWFLPQSPQTFP
jgi:hypothetical protein